MNSIEKDIMLGMINILNEASYAYYNTGNTILTDEQYDSRLKDLQEFEKETGVVFSNSPTINVGTTVLNSLPEAIHNHKMLSLAKVHSVDEIIKFSNNKELVASVKCDGMTASLLYEDGNFVKGESRGNGYVGVDITEHIKQFLNVPLKINKNGRYIVDGECIIEDNDFEEININNEFANSRNTVAGTLNSLDTSVVSQRRIKFVLWDVIEGGCSNNLADNLSEAQSLGFGVVPYWYPVNLDSKKLQNTLDYVFEYSKEMGIPTDGVVFKFNDIEYGKSLGYVEHHFKNGIAYKREDDVYKTELINIEWTMGKTGTLTPTAVFRPVEIDGTTVERASVHNVSILTKLDLRIGDTVEVVKSNQIIPQIKRNVSADERMALGKEPDYIALPHTCPVCGGLTDIRQDNNSKVLVCTNDNCKGKLLGKLTHFVSKNAINVDGLSEQTLQKFIELGWLSSFEDIFTLKDHFTEMVKLDGFGETSVKKLLNAISESKNTTLDRFIYSLSIKYIGRTASKEISQYCNEDIDAFCKLINNNNIDILKTINGLGSNSINSLKDWINKNYLEFLNLKNKLNFLSKPKSNYKSILNNYTFCITGKLQHYENRDELVANIEKYGGKYSKTLNKNTNYLINNDFNSVSSKNKKAKELGCAIINETDFIRMINEVNDGEEN